MNKRKCQMLPTTMIWESDTNVVMESIIQARIKKKKKGPKRLKELK